ncbi:hypothetical protein AKO1_015507, partial [Acrasis kona]
MECTSDNVCTNTGRVQTGSVTIQQEASTVVDGSGSTTVFTTTGTLYDRTFTNPINSSLTFRQDDVVAYKTALQVAASDVDALNLQITNAWVCYSTTSNNVVYDPSRGLYGCSAPSAGNGVTAASIVQIIRNGAVASSTPAEASFAASTLAGKSIAALPYRSTVGLTFTVKRLVDYSTPYFIQIETQVTPVTSSRTLKTAKSFSLRSTTTAVQVASIRVDADRSLTNIGGNTSSGKSLQSGWVFLVAILLCLLL